MSTKARERPPKSIPIVYAQAREGEYFPSHVDVRFDYRTGQPSEFTRRQKEALRCLLAGLKDRHATLASGRHVETAADAVRWLLDAIANQIESNGAVKS